MSAAVLVPERPIRNMRPNWNVRLDRDMELGLFLMVASGALGFAAGRWIKAFVLELVSLAVALVAAFLLQSSGYGFKDGAIVLVGALLVGQAAYFGGLFLRSRAAIRSLLVGDVLDNGPDSGGEGDVANDNEKRD
jgi:hypothetical protein